jgi:hypothetical protein
MHSAVGANRIHTWMLAGGSHEAFEIHYNSEKEALEQAVGKC